MRSATSQQCPARRGKSLHAAYGIDAAGAGHRFACYVRLRFRPLSPELPLSLDDPLFPESDDEPLFPESDDDPDDVPDDDVPPLPLLLSDDDVLRLLSLPELLLLLVPLEPEVEVEPPEVSSEPLLLLDDDDGDGLPLLRLRSFSPLPACAPSSPLPPLPLPLPFSPLACSLAAFSARACSFAALAWSSRDRSSGGTSSADMNFWRILGFFSCCVRLGRAL